MGFASSSSPDDRLGELLLRRGRLTFRQYADAGKAIVPGLRLGAILVELARLRAPDKAASTLGAGRAASVTVGDSARLAISRQQVSVRSRWGGLLGGLKGSRRIGITWNSESQILSERTFRGFGVFTPRVCPPAERS